MDLQSLMLDKKLFKNSIMIIKYFALYLPHEVEVLELI